MSSRPRSSILLAALAALAAALLLGVTLTTSALLARSAHLVERAQGEALASAVHAATRPRFGSREEVELGAILEAQRAYGMRGLVSYEADGDRVDQAGEGGPWPERAPQGEEHRVSPTRMWRIVRAPDGPPGGPMGGPPPRHHEGERHGPPPHKMRRERTFIIEYEPAEATRLFGAARRLTLVGGLAAGLLLAGAWFLWRALEREARARHSQQQAAHLAHVGQMSATLAHEIRTPLTALKGHAQLLEATLEPASAAQKKAARVVGEAARLERLIEGLLAFVRSGRVAREPGSPVEVVRRAAQSAGVACVIEADGAPEVWSIDAARLEQAARNLLENAAREGEGQAVEVVIAAREGVLEILVGDHGPGVSEEVLARLGEAFFTTHASGTGLGLAVADTVARAHGGRLRAQNREGGGAWFVLELGA